MFSFFKKKPAAPPATPLPAAPPPVQGGSMIGSALVQPIEVPAPAPVAPERQRWLDKLSAGLRKTGSSISQVFTGAQIDDHLYEELESALLMADTGVNATQYLLDEVKRRVQASGATRPVQVKNILADSLAQLLRPLEKALVIGEHRPTVIMVEIVSQEGGDPAAVAFDAVSAGRARGKDVVLVDTAGRLPTQLHLMEELKKIKRSIQKAGPAAAANAGDAAGPPHEVLLVIDGNTGQNALAQVRAFDDALQLTGLIVTKLDGTAKGGVLAAIAQEKPVPVYFIGVGEKLEDLETFNAREFALALLS